MHRTLKLNNLTNIVVSLAYICEALSFYGLEWTLYSARSENLRLQRILTTQIKCSHLFATLVKSLFLMFLMLPNTFTKLIKWLKSYNATNCWAFYWWIKLSIIVTPQLIQYFHSFYAFLCFAISSKPLCFTFLLLWVACHKFAQPLRSCETDAATGQTTGQRHQCRFRIPQ